eukprot:s2705_g2.t1
MVQRPRWRKSLQTGGKLVATSKRQALENRQLIGKTCEFESRWSLRLPQRSADRIALALTDSNLWKNGTCPVLLRRFIGVEAASFCFADVALSDMDLRFVCQAQHLATSTFTHCVAGVALATSTFTLCGRRGTYGTQPGLETRLVGASAASFCVAGVALSDHVVTRLVGADAASFCVAGAALS